MSKLTLLTIATIVAGEVGGTVPAARLPVACTVVRDHHRGRDLHHRWYAHATPGPLDLAAARLALNGGCDHLPYFVLLGAFPADLQVWRTCGYIRPTDQLWIWMGPTGFAAVGVVRPSPPATAQADRPNVDFVPQKNSPAKTHHTPEDLPCPN